MNDETVRARRFLTTRLIGWVVPDTQDHSTYRSGYAPSVGGALDSFFSIRLLAMMTAMAATIPVDAVRYAFDRDAAWT